MAGIGAFVIVGIIAYFLFIENKKKTPEVKISTPKVEVPKVEVEVPAPKS
jgi:hypothetical protein